MAMLRLREKRYIGNILEKCPVSLRRRPFVGDESFYIFELGASQCRVDIRLR